jgi:hypothetical protein
LSGLGGRSDGSSGQTPPVGWRRLLQAYVASGLAVVLGLPGLAAGLITANTCQLRGADCVGSSTYGLIGGAGLAIIIQLVLAAQLRLGWRFWLVCLSGVAATVLTLDSAWLAVPVVALLPALAGWATDPRPWRPSGWHLWSQRVGAFVAAGILLVVVGYVTGGVDLPFD